MSDIRQTMFSDKWICEMDKGKWALFFSSWLFPLTLIFIFHPILVGPCLMLMLPNFWVTASMVFGIENKVDKKPTHKGETTFDSDNLYCTFFSDDVKVAKMTHSWEQLCSKMPSRYRQSTKTVTNNIWHVLGIMPTTDRDKVDKAFRKMSMIYHPDTGGTAKTFQMLTTAKEKALEKCK